MIEVGEDRAGASPAGMGPRTIPRRSNKLLWATLAAMVLGLGAGLALDQVGLSASAKASTVSVLELVTRLFLRLLRMVVAPLILSTLIVGISQMGGAGAVGRVGVRALIWFFLCSLAAISIGLGLGNIFAPGAGLHLVAHAGGNVGAVPSIDFVKVIEEMVPLSIADAAAQNKILQIVVFAAFVGVAVGALGERAALVRAFAEQLAQVMFKVAGAVIRAAPVAVFAAMTATTLEHGIGTVATLGRYVVVFYIGLLAMAAALIAVGAAFLGGQIGALLKAMREPLLIAFSTASSEATLPSTFEAVGKLGVSTRITGLVLPMGYAFNLSGTLIYSSFAVLFIAQAYGITMPVASQIGMLFFLMVANKGAAGVPRGALVTLTMTLQTFGLPLEGIGIILGVEALLDMGRTTINVLGNAIATASIARLSEDRERA